MENQNTDLNSTEGGPNNQNNQPERTTIKQYHQNGWKEVNTTFRFYQIDKQTSQKSTPKCGGRKYRNIFI